jgi:ABC-2 type transport system ATP-binding protein
MIDVKDVGMDYQLSKNYLEVFRNPFAQGRRHTALRGVSFQIEHGERIAFLGPNGAGKTTLLKLIGGILYPSSGNIIVNGKDTLTDNLAARKAVGFVLNEERSFFWRLTAVQNLEFFGTLDNISKSLLSRKIKELIALVKLEHASNRPVGTFSSGMKQALSIARALLCDPQILILDEPTRALDPVAAEDIKTLLLHKMQQYSSLTLLVATHTLEEAQALCERVCVIIKGEVVTIDNISSILQRHGTLKTFYLTVNKTISE